MSQDATFRDNIRRLAAADRPFDICMSARKLPLAAALVDAAPEVQFVLDHCGVPDIAAGAWDDWARDIVELARRPNLCAKTVRHDRLCGARLDAGRAVALGPARHRLLRPRAGLLGRRLAGCTPNGGLSPWVAASRAILAQLSPDERARIWRGTAADIWGV